MVQIKWRKEKEAVAYNQCDQIGQFFALWAIFKAFSAN